MKHLLAVAVLLLLPSAAFAQGSGGPFGGLFGRTPERIGRDYTVFELRTSASVQGDDALFTTVDDSLDAGLGMASGINGSVNFERKMDYLEFRARTAATYIHLMQSPSVGWTSTDSGVALSGRLGTRLSVDVSAQHFYSPFFTFHPLLFIPAGATGIQPPAATMTAAGLVENHTVDGRFAVNSQYAKHSTLSAFVNRRETRFMQQRDHDQSLAGYGAEWRRQVSRGFGVRLGYTRETVHERGRPEDEFVHELIDVGIDFLKPLSLSRRTTLMIATQTAMLKRQDTGRHYRLNGQVTLTSMFRRTWKYALSAQRTTEFIPGFSEPLYADTGSLVFSGLLSRRSQLVLNATAGVGKFGYVEDLGRFRTATGTVQFNFAVTRKVGVFAQYGVYVHDFPAGATGFSLFNDLSRQAAVIGLSAWLPILSPSEASSDSR